MIRITDSLKLAGTKLKTRKVRLVVTVVISSLLFCLLLAGSFVVNGSIQSVESFSKTGFAGRYILRADSFFGNPYDLATSSSLIAKVEQLEKQLNEKKKAESKRLGLEYTDKDAIKLIQEDPSGAAPGKTVDLASPFVAPLISEILAETEKINAEKFVEITNNYQATATYESVPAKIDYTEGLNVIVSGKEDISKLAPTQNMGFGPSGVETFSGQWNSIDSELLTPFLLPNQSAEIGQDGSIPVIAPYSAAEEITGFQKLSPNAKPQERLKRLEEVRAKAAGYTFEACYRNPSSVEKVNNAVAQQQDIANNKNTKDYVKPALIYDIPTAPCGDVVLVQDKRTAAEKTLAAKQDELEKILGKQEPRASIIKFRIIGINAEMSDSYSLNVSTVLSSFLLSSLGTGWYSPLEAVKQNPTTSPLFDDTKYTNNNYYSKFRLAEFATAAQLKKIIDEQNCVPDYSGSFENFDPLKQCEEMGKSPYILGSFGSNSAAIDEFQRFFSKAFFIAAAAVALIAGLIMMGTVGRIIADSRRETAVFRAIGAKRIDIAQIYLTYTFLVACLIAGFSIIVGWLIAVWTDNRYSSEASVNALLAFNVQDLSKEFHIIGFELKDVATVVGLIILASIIAGAITLAGNIRRNPINDMRDER